MSRAASAAAIPASKRARASSRRGAGSRCTSRTPRASVIGPWPGTITRGVELEDPIAGGEPVRDRPRPHDRRALDEQDVAGEDDAVVRHVGDHVARGVRRPDLEQRAPRGRRPQVALPSKARSGSRAVPAKSNRREVVRAAKASNSGAEVELLEERVDELRRRRARISASARAEATIGMPSGSSALPYQWSPLPCVFTRWPMGAPRSPAAHRVEHLARQALVEERVDEQRLTAGA